MAFRREALDAIGPFDELLGAGSRCRGGEDLDAFVRLLRAGWTVAYEPSALAWHTHRADRAGLRRQLFGYGVGLSAYLAKHLTDRSRIKELVVKAPAGVAHARSLLARDDADARARSSLDLRAAEVAGWVAGPVIYARERHAARRIPA
jgi:GT2 family glycosyltransferase